MLHPNQSKVANSRILRKGPTSAVISLTGQSFLLNAILGSSGAMRQDWLETKMGINVVAIGSVALTLSLVIFTLQDVSILLAGKLIAFGKMRGIFYLLLATIATLVSALSVFIWRPGLHRIVIGLFSISMASHVVEQFIFLPTPQMKAVALCRIAVALGLILLFLRYIWSTKAANSP
jgi:hypothetical protein